MFNDFFRQLKLWNLSRKGYAQTSKIRHSSTMTKKHEWLKLLSMIFCAFMVWGTSCGSLFYQNSQKELSEYFIQFLGVFIFIILIAYCLEAMKKEIFTTSREVILISFITCLQISLSLLVFYIFSHPEATNINTSNLFLLACLPVAWGSLCVAPLLGLRVAFCVAIYTGVIIALQGKPESQLAIFMMSIMSSTTAAIMVRHQRKRSFIIYTISILFLVKILFLFTTYNEEIINIFRSHIWLNIGTIIGVCFFSVILANILLPIFEYLFGMVTDQSLLELNDLNHPLLKQLQINAPGTYHHSLMVANIAEAAAEAIHANALLTKVCCYFHDIGKLTHPEYFTENNRDTTIHEELHPHMSSIIILNHVKEGLELAYQYKLNKIIRDAIMQHHGTSLISFFYHKAKENNPEQIIGEEDYRYPGPLAKRKEIVILSLADACEACIRSLSKPTPQKIRIKVEEIFRSRFLDHQLDEADLTLEELNIVRETIIKTLSGMMHGRVHYPYPGKHHHEYSTVKTDTQL